MRVLVINPNTTAAMTTHVAAQLRLYLPQDVELIERTTTFGGPVIATAQAFATGAEAAASALAQAIREDLAFDSVLLACFGDPGLEALRAMTPVPVTGLAKACMRHAESNGQPYAVVTSGAGWKTILNKRFADWGASSLYCGTHVIRATGLEVFSDPMGAMPAVLEGIASAKHVGAQHIILGGAVLAGYKALMAQSSVQTQGLADCVEGAAKALLQA
ncbi:MAG: aspartate/glutamate racemase family protein [Pseudomonadota bacterium]